jgi:hypothetical protein
VKWEHTPPMKYVLLILVLGGAWLGWKKYNEGQPPEPAAVNDPNKTPGANAENRVNNLSGQVPMP